MFNSLKSEKEKSLLDRLGTAAKHQQINDVLHNFPVFTARQNIARFLNRHEMFKKILNIHGCIIEFGIFKGAGLFSWIHFSSIYEPYNLSRKIIGFDSFQGFPSISKKDSKTSTKGLLKSDWQKTLQECKNIAQQNSSIPHVCRTEIVKGDICSTLPRYLIENPQTIIALAYVDVDIYKPTKTILNKILNRMPKGAILAFDELNDPLDKGETVALLETLKIKNYKIQRNTFDSYPSFIEIE